MTGTTIAKLGKIKTYDVKYPFQVGVNGVNKVTEIIDDEGVTLTEVEYVVDGIKYKTRVIDGTPEDSSNRRITTPKLNTLQFTTVLDRNLNSGVIGLYRRGKNIFYELPSEEIEETEEYDLRVYSDSQTTYEIDETEFNSGSLFFQKLPIFKKEINNGFIEEPKIESELFIERQQASIFERHQRMEDINSVDDFSNYRNNFYKVNFN